jgi:5-(carboxyamino)imidazole ribonucleotide mutase
VGPGALRRPAPRLAARAFRAPFTQNGASKGIPPAERGRVVPQRGTTYLAIPLRLRLSHGVRAKKEAQPKSQALIGIIMGSQSDWETMQHAASTLQDLGVPFEASVVSAHRTPDLLFEYASTAADRGLHVIIAGAGGAAHLPGMCAAKTSLPVLGVPVESKVLKGIDSLLSIVQMPGGVPVGTLAIGKAGAINAALLATAILGAHDVAYRQAYEKFRRRQTTNVLGNRKPGHDVKG